MKKALLALLCLICIGSLGANAFLFQKYSSRRPVVRFSGGGQVSVKEFRDELEFHHGRETLRRLVLSRLVETAAKKAGLWPDRATVKARIAEMERIAPDGTHPGRLDPARTALFEKQLAVEIALENLSIQSVKISDAEARAFYGSHPQMFRLPRQAKVTMVVTRTDVDAGTAQRMMARKDVTEAVLAMQPGMNVVGLNGFDPDLSVLPAPDREKLRNVALSLQPGAVARLAIGDAWFVLRGEAQEAAEIPPFDSVKEKARRLAALTKATPRDAMLAELYRNAGVVFEMDYRDWFSDLRSAPLQTPRVAQRP